MLAKGLSERGHTVTVVTQTTTANEFIEDDSYMVIRRPRINQLMGAVEGSEVVLHCNISLRTAWPLLFFRKPWVIGHHIWLEHKGVSVAARIKKWCIQRAINLSPSKALAAGISNDTIVIPNAYKTDVFRISKDIERTRDLVFVGRLVEDKGIDILIEALARLKESGICPTTSIIGEGILTHSLVKQVEKLRLSEQVQFLGSLRGDALARKLNEHRIMVIPSRWQEPFGIVALEGIACGWYVIAANTGGLPEAVGSCGNYFKHCDIDSLAEAIANAIDHYPDCLPIEKERRGHLDKFTPEKFIESHERILQEALAGKIS